MRGFIGILFLALTFLGCNSEEGLDCFKKQGTQTTKVIFVEGFTKINISEGIELTVKQADEQTVKVVAGKNLINDIKLEVIEGELKVTDENGCEILRNTSIAHIYVSTPSLEKIYSSSQFSIYSDGVLTFPELTLESGIIEDTSASIFELEIDNDILRINDNVSSVFRIKGKTNQLGVNFWGANGRLEAENLQAAEVYINHRSTNDMIVYPVEKVSGSIRSTGNLVLKNIPPIIDVEQLYTGHIVYP